MRNIEFYINTKLADFTDLEQLPLSMSKKTDAFTELVGVGGIEVEQVVKTLSFPMTNNNCDIFRADMLGSVTVRGDTKFGFQLLSDGNKISSGSLRLKNIIKRTDGTSHFIAEVTDSVLSIWEQLENTSLNDLDLGTQVWTQTTIEDSWSQNVDDINGIFAPICYGVVTSTMAKNFHARDFRFSVYYIPIMKAIFKKIGYTLESDFFDTEYMRAAVYCYSNGKNLKGTEIAAEYQVIAEIYRIRLGGSYLYNTVENKDIKTQFTPSTRRFTPSTGGYFTFTIVCNCSQPFTVNIQKNGVDSLNLVTTETGISKTIMVELLLSTTDYIEFYLTTSPDLADNDLMRASVHIDLKDEVGLNSTFRVSSCLHNKPVKEFLRGVTHQFCGAWHVNEPLKRVYFEPRFKGYYGTYKGVNPIIERFDGFYSEQTQPIDIDVSSIDIEMQKPFGNSLIIGYAPDSNDPIEKYLKKDSTATPYDTKIIFNDRNGKENTNRNPYFTNLYMGVVQGIESSILPCILPSSFEVGKVLPGTVVSSVAQGEVTFEGSPKCGLVWYGGISIYIDGVAKVNVPLITQQIEYTHGNRNFSMMYGDFKAASNGGQIRGLLSIFHLKYFAIIRQGIKLTVQANVFLTDILQTNFRKLEVVEVEGTPQKFINLSIDNLKLVSGETAQYNLMQSTEPNQTDVEKTITVHDIAVVVPDTV